MNLDACQKVVAVMREREALSDDDGALVQSALSLAAAVDDDSGNAALWKEYRAVLSDLRRLGEDSSSDFDRIVAGLQAAVSDSTDGPAHARAEVRGGS